MPRHRIAQHGLINEKPRKYTNKEKINFQLWIVQCVNKTNAMDKINGRMDENAKILIFYYPLNWLHCTLFLAFYVRARHK